MAAGLKTDARHQLVLGNLGHFNLQSPFLSDNLHFWEPTFLGFDIRAVVTDAMTTGVMGLPRKHVSLYGYR